MSTRSIVPFGPQHPVLPEPIHLDLVLEDEKVVEAHSFYWIYPQRVREISRKKRF